MNLHDAIGAVARDAHPPLAGPPVCPDCGKRHMQPWRHEGQCSIKGCSEPALKYQGKVSLFCKAHSVETLSRELIEEMKRNDEGNEIRAGRAVRNGGRTLPVDRGRQLDVLEPQAPALRLDGVTASANPEGRPTLRRVSEGGAQDYWIVRSRNPKTPDWDYRVDLTTDGDLLCNCAAAANHLLCWHVTEVRKELEMTTTSTALVPVIVRPPTSPLPTSQEMGLIDRAADLAFRGAIALPRELNTPQKVAAVMLYGWELGLKPMSALRHIYIVNGRPQPSAEVMAGLFAQSGGRLEVMESTDARCTIRLVRGTFAAEYTCTWAEYEKTGLSGSDISKKYPRDRLRWHTTKRILRIYAPDVINGMGASFEDEPLPERQTYVEVLPADADLYNEGDDEWGEQTDIETHAPPPSPPPPAATPESAPRAPRAPSPSASPSPGLQKEMAAFMVEVTAAKKDVADVVKEARRLFGKNLSACTLDEKRASLANITGVILPPAAARGCDHEPMYDTEGKFLCGKCGVAMDDTTGLPVVEAPEQEGLPI